MDCETCFALLSPLIKAAPSPEWSREGLAAAPRGCCVILKIVVSCLQQPMGLAEKRCTLTEE